MYVRNVYTWLMNFVCINVMIFLIYFMEYVLVVATVYSADVTNHELQFIIFKTITLGSKLIFWKN